MRLEWVDVAKGFVFAWVGGGIGVGIVLAGLRKWLRLPSDDALHGTEARRVPNWFTGVVERTFFVTVIAYNVSGAAVAMIAWLTLKQALNWNRTFGAEDRLRAERVQRAFAALLSGLVSMLFAVVGGLVAQGTLG